jgi:magnesium and cobalt exporter, CNNM family
LHVYYILAMLFIELVIVVALILLNGLLAMAELAVVSARRARLQALINRQVVGARRALALASEPGKFLSTVQIGITLNGILSGAFSGATLGQRLAQWFAAVGMAPGIAEIAGVGLVVAAITYVSLIVGELVPKQIALRDPERIAVRVAPAMTALATIASPVVWLLDISGRSVLRLLGYGREAGHGITDDEIKTLIAEAETAGVIEPSERAMIAGVMRLGDRPVRAVMTPRRDVDMVDLSADPESIRRTILESIHSRLPVYDGVPDEMLGVLQAKDLLEAYLRDEPPDLRACVRPAPNVPDTADALDVLEVIKAALVHMALIHDEYGHFQGVVTNADILEAIVGVFRTAESEPDAVQRKDGSWLIAGSMPVDEMAERLDVTIPLERNYHTAAGFALDRLGHLPQIGESFDTQGWRFEIVDIDGRRIDKILAARLAGTRRRASN